jgi:very-short-patch-repair endonuclease
MASPARSAIGGIQISAPDAFKNYILDFVCFEQKLVVELDGGQHSGNQLDQIRDGVLATEGFKVVRYWNNDVLRNAEGVLIDLLTHLR